MKSNNKQILSPDQESIVALCTPSSCDGAIALIRISGKDAIEVASKMGKLACGQSLIEKASHTIHYGWITKKQDINTEKIDQVLFLLMKGPKTFTGQDTVEITCHNNQFIVQKIIDIAIECGARIASNGEFTKRAFLNNKIDLVQAESINDLIKSQTQIAIKSSLQQLDGSLSSEIKNIEDDLIKALAFSESSFEFIEDENIEFWPQIKDLITRNIEKIKTLKKTFDNQRQIKEGVKIAIIGSVNAGKSSLFNALIKQNKAIVTNIAGTTRDTIEANIIINSQTNTHEPSTHEPSTHDSNTLESNTHDSNTLESSIRDSSTHDSYTCNSTLYSSSNATLFNATLIDTAGLRETNDQIEQVGIEKSFEAAHGADIILLVFDASRSFTNQEANIYTELIKNYCQKIIYVANKSDIKANNFEANFAPNLIFISTRDNNNTNNTNNTNNNNSNTKNSNNTKNNNLDLLEVKIGTKIKELFYQTESPFLINKRQFNLLSGLEQKLKEILPIINKNTEYEILSYKLKDAISNLSELTGKTIDAKSIDLIFKEFCIGK